MKKKVIVIVLLFVLTATLSSGLTYALVKRSINENTNTITIKKNKGVFKNALSMMLETGSNTDTYELTTANEWPTSGYKFNSKLSKCENGGSVSWDFKNKNVVMEGTASDKCYIYFDKIVTVNEYCNAGTNLADCIKTFGNAGYDTSSIYIHDSSLKNGANDNSYRFAGASDYVNNYVCFGSDAEVCPTDNLYRIIGVFGDQVKLIKSDFATSTALGTNGAYTSNTYSASSYSNYKGSLTSINRYYWHTSSSNTWSAAALNTTNLNGNYISYLGTTWTNMIATTTWKVGGNTWANIGTSAMYTAYKNEITSPAESTTYNAKIGLMYVSDYGYAASPTYWTYAGYNSSDSSKDYRAAINANWMYSGVYEWTITRRSDTTDFAFYVRNTGYVYSYGGVSDYDLGVRPVFYLKNSINYNGGSGTKDSPIKLENTEVTLANYVKSQYTGSQGDNNLYYHNGTIKSNDGTVIDANDGSYRYAGSSDTTNNYVCFGSTASTCPTDNLYRIIGVFGDQVKLIKYDYATSAQLGITGAYYGAYDWGSDYYKGSNYSNIASYYWTSSDNTSNVWSGSALNTTNLNETYLTNLGTTWTNKIETTTWKVGGNTQDNIQNVTASNAYQNEIVSPSTTYSAKIGLMYASDYGFAASPSAWSTTLFKYSSSSVRSVNWMYMGLHEWTISRMVGEPSFAFVVNIEGYVDCGDVVYYGDHAVRPVFYLTSSVTKTGGSGTSSDPYLIA